MAGLFGLIVGSHLATIALRWPVGRSSAMGRSACDGCGRTLRIAELVPLLSWLILRGRCRRCSARIDPRHPAVEAAAAGLAVLMAWTLPPAAAIAGMGLAWTLLLLTVLDLDHYWLPDRLTLPLLAGGLAVAAGGVGPDLTDRAIGAVAGWGVLAAVALIYRRWRGRDGLGGGDPKLFGAVGAWVGWQMLPTVLTIASVTGLLVVLAGAVARRRISAATQMPFGPLLALGAVVGWVWVGR
ncbi:prepilin peptidase [Sphingomonas montana]|uniref:prepilin peptidase n=1 Tax=Sphingomonas montana TaxID=1843236 RepID=UPI001F0A43F4|nr:A24 family peptidase [Sphingomonas montana]